MHFLLYGHLIEVTIMEELLLEEPKGGLTFLREVAA